MKKLEKYHVDELRKLDLKTIEKLISICPQCAQLTMRELQERKAELIGELIKNKISRL